MVNAKFRDRRRHGFEMVDARRNVAIAINRKFTAISVGGIFRKLSPS
jgi:hypothetical protein